MSSKRPIDLKRESDFSGTIGTGHEGAIKEFLNIGSMLLMIKEKAICKFQLADQIDPQRSNIRPTYTAEALLHWLLI
jgi:hypothetical protein